MILRRLHHVQLLAPAGCESQARAFYTGLLGMEEIAKPANLAVRGGAWFRGTDFEVHVSVDAEFRPASKSHPAFEVEHLDMMRQHLQAHHVVTYEDEPLPGFRRFYASDPFGNRLEFLQPWSATHSED